MSEGFIVDVSIRLATLILQEETKDKVEATEDNLEIT
jgi:hypothetical protein